jgi:lipoyl-dependent peroxiredoxin
MSFCGGIRQLSGGGPLKGNCLERLYTAVARVTGGRNGRATIADRPGHLDMAEPSAMEGSGDGFNPEQLFAVAYGACFGSALDLEARQQGIVLGEITVSPHVSIGHGDDGYFMLSIALHVRLPDVDSRTAERLMAATHATCPYSRMTRGAVEVQLVLDRRD